MSTEVGNNATNNTSIIKAGTPRRIPLPDYLSSFFDYLSSFFGASPTRNGLYDLDLFAGTGVLDKATDVDDAVYTGVGALEAGVMRLYGVVMILGRWVRVGCARLSSVHSSVPTFLWAGAGECANTRPAQRLVTRWDLARPLPRHSRRH